MKYELLLLTEKSRSFVFSTTEVGLSPNRHILCLCAMENKGGFTDCKSGDLLLTRRSERRYAELTHSLSVFYAEFGFGKKAFVL